MLLLPRGAGHQRCCATSGNGRGCLLLPRGVGRGQGWLGGATAYGGPLLVAVSRYAEGLVIGTAVHFRGWCTVEPGGSVVGVFRGRRSIYGGVQRLSLLLSLGRMVLPPHLHHAIQAITLPQQLQCLCWSGLASDRSSCRGGSRSSSVVADVYGQCLQRVACTPRGTLGNHCQRRAAAVHVCLRLH